MPTICKYSIKISQDKLDKIIKTVHLNAVKALNVDNRLDDIRNLVLDRTENYINSHRRRPADPSKVHIIDVLRETSFVERVDETTFRLGIGDEGELNSKVPYWYVVNYGGIPPDWSAGEFYGIFQDGRPVPGGRGNTWFDHGTSPEGKMYKMKPKNPIPPMHYLNYMAQEFSKEIKKLQGKIKK